MSDRLRTGRKQHAPRALGFYPTERPLVRILLPYIAHLRGRVLAEPCCGDGAIGRVLEEDGHEVMASDIADRGYGEAGRDFFAATSLPGVAAIVTNPPYADDVHGVECHAAMVRHALRLMAPIGGLVAMLLPHDFDTASGRYDLLCGPPFAFRLTALWRPIWIPGTDGGGRTTSAWHVWDWAHEGPARCFYARRPS